MSGTLDDLTRNDPNLGHWPTQLSSNCRSAGRLHSKIGLSLLHGAITLTYAMQSLSYDVLNCPISLIGNSFYSISWSISREPILCFYQENKFFVYIKRTNSLFLSREQILCLYQENKFFVFIKRTNLCFYQENKFFVFITRTNYFFISRK